MTEPAKKPADKNGQGKDDFLEEMKERARSLLSVSIPSEGMGLAEMKRNLETMKEMLGLGRK